MKAKEVLATLKKLGRPSVAEIYKRHGSGDNDYGCSPPRSGSSRRRSRSTTRSPWSSGSRATPKPASSALQVADAESLSASEAEGFIRDTDSGFVGCYLSGLVARSPVADKKMASWMKSPKEFVRETGYGVFSFRLKQSPIASATRRRKSGSRRSRRKSSAPRTGRATP
jgi:hypothetical protein